MLIENVPGEEDKSFILNELLFFFLVKGNLKNPLAGDSHHLD